MRNSISRLALSYESRTEAPFVVGSLVAIPPARPLTGGIEVMEIFRGEAGTVLAEFYDADGRLTCIVDLKDLMDHLTDAVTRFAK